MARGGERVNRTAATILALAVVMFLAGVALFSPRLALIVGAVVVFLVGLGQLDVGDRR